MTGQKSLHVYSSLHLLPDRTAAHLLRVAAASTQQKEREKKKEMEGIFLKSHFQEDKLNIINILLGNLMPDKRSGPGHLLFAVGYFTPVNLPTSRFLFFILRNPALF